MFKNAYRAAKSALRNKAVQASTAVMVTAGNAMAAVDPAISTAISDGTADGKTIAIGILILIIGIGVLRHVRKGV
jgi:hypothetical protein